MSDSAGNREPEAARVRSVALVGTGMIGGSLALALRQAGAVERVVGWDRDAGAAERARALGIVDAVATDAADAAAEAELVVLAVPVRATAEVVSALGLAARPEVIVTDVGSTKSEVLRAVERALPHPERFVGGHPIAGTERSGPEAADARLFAGRRCLLTPTGRTRPEALARVRGLWQAAGAEVQTIDPERHDRLLAYVSHLPHAVAFALAATVGSVEAAGLSGGGFADTTRIAASDPAMWRDVFLANRGFVLEAIAAFRDELAALERAVAVAVGEGAGEGGDGAAALEALIARARAARARVLTGAGR